MLKRKGLVTSMNCSGFDKGGSAKMMTEECIIPASTTSEFHFPEVLFRSEINWSQICSIQKLFSLHKSCNSSALSAVDSKSPVLALILVIFIYDIHLHSNKHFCFSICLISSPASTSLFPLHYLLFLTIFPAYSFFSHILCGSSVITVFFGMRMSFHRGTGGGRVGSSSGHARVLVKRTTWLCSREKPYWCRTSDDTVCALEWIIFTQK